MTEQPFSFNAAEPWHAPMAWAPPVPDMNDLDLASRWLESRSRPQTAVRIARLAAYTHRFMVDSYAACVADSLVDSDVTFSLNSVSKHARRLSDDEREAIRLARGRRLIACDLDGIARMLDLLSDGRSRSLREVTEAMGWGKISTQGAITLLEADHPGLSEVVDLGIY